MKVEIKQKTKQPLFSREQIIFEAEKDTTPKRKELQENIAAQLGANPEHIVVREIKTIYGTSKVKGTIHIYENKENMLKNEPKHIIERTFGKPEKKEPEKK
jgi:ribosomal protein S24E